MVKIEDIQRIALDENEALWVTIRRGDKPNSIYQQEVQTVYDTLSTMFLTTRIIVTSEDIDIKAVTIPEELSK